MKYFCLKGGEVRIMLAFWFGEALLLPALRSYEFGYNSFNLA